MSRSQKFHSLKLSIFLSSGLLVLLCVLSNLIGWIGQRQLLANFEAYEQAERTAAKILAVDRIAQQLKFRAESYAQTGAEPQFHTAVDLQQQLVEHITALQREADSQTLTELLEQMQLHIETFGDELQLTFEERQLRTALRKQQLPKAEDQVDLALADFDRALKRLATEPSSGEPSFSFAAIDLFESIQAYALARKHMWRYFIDPSSKDFQIMRESLLEARQKIDHIQLPGEAREAAAAQRVLASALEDFQVLGTRAVQATRGYLFYTNVVMAGEISEFVHYSNELKRYVQNVQAENRQARIEAVRNIRAIGVSTSVISVLLACGLAAYLSYVILQPITALTRTFLQLSDGATIDSIPAAERSDEIGRMARAAEVFSRKNQQTQELLARSQSLSEALALKARDLEATNNELDKFAYVASHDLKSPLRGLNSLAEWVQEDCGHLLPEASQAHLQLMKDRVKKMEALLNDLLDYSRAGRELQSPERIDAHEMVQSMLAFTDNETGVQIHFVDQLPVLTTLKAPLQQVFLNLLTNAIKYNDKGSKGLVLLATEDAGEFYRFSVTDNGIGIERKYHERIFQMYQRVAAKKADGTGMGLAIVKKQVESQGGRVSVTSVVGESTTFSFTWPKQYRQSPAPNVAAAS